MNSCTFTQRENETNVLNFKNHTALNIAKKAIGCACENKSDSLVALFREDIKKTLTDKQLSNIIKEVQATSTVAEFPSDSSIRVIRSNTKSFLGEKKNYSFVFPFKNKLNNEIKNIEIKLENEKIVSLFVTKRETTKIVKVF